MTLPFFITDAAAKRIMWLKNAESDIGHFWLRVCVSGGGCSGFQYHFTLDDKVGEGDVVFSHEGADVVIDEASLSLLQDSTLDYQEEMVGSSFVIRNPNAASSCGCGNSFSL